jgi:hypothetical protein
MDPTSEPGDRRPARRLDRAPGDRYRSSIEPPSGEAGDSVVRPTSPPRGLLFAIGGGLVGGLLIVLLAGVLAISVGLLVLAFLTGWLVAEGLRIGGGATIAPRIRRQLIADVIAVVSVALAQVGVWLFARSEGGALELTDYLWQTFGWVAPAQLVIAGVTAWWKSR